MTPVQKQLFKSSVMRALHAPGGPFASGSGKAVRQGETRPGENGAGRNILEMTIVFDCSLTREDAKAYGADIIGALKSSDEIFRNTRLNVVRWISDGEIRRDVTAAPMLQMGGYFADYEQRKQQKTLECLTGNLKKFDARSRLVILVTDGGFGVSDARKLQESLNPFLYRRLVIVEPDRIREGAEFLAKQKV